MWLENNLSQGFSMKILGFLYLHLFYKNSSLTHYWPWICKFFSRTYLNNTNSSINPYSDRRFDFEFSLIIRLMF